ncbi:hypothetical protein LAZ67_5000104 [Cordylochernes scorpioides]|uniref:Histone-lysine N-methyltransferase SETMAR n=1 Tax=Cordylochernes scorpioides TaxID=51811 RepID=A0ABY6KJD0_9ARAC|nr:hypothetical protein LAZ67_5000104 [Cordylochernes scorpioides]
MNTIDKTTPPLPVPSPDEKGGGGAVTSSLKKTWVQLARLIVPYFEVLEHPAYSPDLSPSDYFLFGQLKKELKGKRFDSDEDVQKVVQEYFHTLPKSAYKEGIYKLPERWRRCIESQGVYFE